MGDPTGRKVVPADPRRRHLVISGETRQLLAAHALHGKLAAPVNVFRDGSCVIDVDEEVYRSLLLIDQDPDRAIRILCTTGVGRA